MKSRTAVGGDDEPEFITIPESVQSMILAEGFQGFLDSLVESRDELDDACREHGVTPILTLVGRTIDALIFGPEGGE